MRERKREEGERKRQRRSAGRESKSDKSDGRTGRRCTDHYRGERPDILLLVYTSSNAKTPHQNSSTHILQRRRFTDPLANDRLRVQPIRAATRDEKTRALHIRN